MKNSWIAYILFILLLSSCQKEIDVKLPKQPSRLGVEALWNRDQALQVTVTRTFSVLETPQFDYQTNPPTVENKLKAYSVNNAKVTVFKNGLVYDELIYDPAQYLYKSSAGKIAEAGAAYSVVVSAPGFTEVKAPVMTFPQEVPIRSVEIKRKVSSEVGGSTLDELVIEFDDPKATKNYYWLVLDRKYSSTSSNPRYYIYNYIYPVDPDIIVAPSIELEASLSSVEADRILLTDDNFNGQTKRVTIRMSSYMLDPNPLVEVTISLNNVGKDIFDYQRSRVLGDVDLFFSTPVQAFSNITNGLGIFGLYSGETRKLQ